MKRHLIAGLSVLGVMAGVGWQLASHPETSAGLQEVSLNQHSEHSQPGSTDALSRIRIRVMPGDEIRVTTDQVPQIPLTAE